MRKFKNVLPLDKTVSEIYYIPCISVKLISNNHIYHVALAGRRAPIMTLKVNVELCKIHQGAVRLETF